MTASVLKAMVPTSIWIERITKRYGVYYLQVLHTKGKTRKAPVMANERRWNDFPQPNHTNVIGPQTRTESARYDLKVVRNFSMLASSDSILCELPEKSLEGICL